MHAITDARGRFLADVLWHPDSLLRIRIAHLAYDPHTKSVRAQLADSRAYDLGSVILQPRSIDLDEILVEKRPDIMFRGDTIFFETDHIQVAEGAYTEELMRRISGMQVDERGRLTYQGRLIEHVRLNGIDFFGGDVALALRNLPADLIRRLQLIEFHGEHYEFTGVRSANPTHILNLSVDDEHTLGKFSEGKLGAGSGAARVFNGGLNIFNKETQGSVVLGTNTIEDPTRYTSASAGASPSNPGLNTVTGIAATYSDRLSDQATGYLFYAWNRTDQDQYTRSASTQSYGDATEIVSSDDQRRHSRTLSHDIGQLGVQNTFVWNARNNRTRLDIRPVFAHQVTEGSGSQTSSRSFYEEGVRSSMQHSRTTVLDRNRLFSAQLNMNGSHRFENGHSATFILMQKSNMTGRTKRSAPH